MIKKCYSDADSLTARVYSFEEMLLSKGYLVYTNVGNSMMPFLRERRDIIVIQKKDPAVRCKRYDVVLYKFGKKYILHRILSVRPNDYVICGDHNIWREYGITDDHILGVMTRVIRDGRTITVDNKWYKLYMHLWVDCYHIKATILFCKMFFRVIAHRIKKFFSRVK